MSRIVFTDLMQSHLLFPMDEAKRMLLKAFDGINPNPNENN